MEIRRIDNNTYDVFTGCQWSTWARVRQGRSSTYQMAGSKLAKPILKELHDILDPNMPITPGQDVHTMLFNNHAINTRHV